MKQHYRRRTIQDVNVRKKLKNQNQTTDTERVVNQVLLTENRLIYLCGRR